MIGLVFSLVLALAQSQSWPDPGQVLSSVNKKENFDSIKTFAWERGVEPFDPDINKLVKAAIEAELTSRGMRLTDSKSAEVIVRYDAVGSTYVDLDELERTTRKDPNAVAPTKALGSLAISMHRNRSTDRMWRGHARDFVDTNPANREASIKAIVAKVFGTYPKRAQ
jgi:hypothetical protein